MKTPTRKIPDSGGGNLVASRVISTLSCKLLSIIALNTNAAQQYIQVHEAAALPAENAVPVMPSIPVAGGAVVQFDLGGVGIDLDACVICNSSTPEKKTIGAADCQILAVLHG